MKAGLLSVAILALTADVGALRFPVVARRSSSLRRRGNVFGVSTLNNSNDFSYYTSLTLGGKTFSQILIDTGSSDLWIAGTVPGANNTGMTAEVIYAIGAVKGPIKLATLEFANHTVPDQAFLEITPSSDNPEGSGLIGLGPNTGSNVFHALNSLPDGDAPIDRIFRANTSTPNFVTALLGRSDDPTDTFPGDVTVSEIVPGYEDILSQPKLNCTQVSIHDLGDQHWQTLLDENGIEVNGKTISLQDTSVNTTSNAKQLTAIFDTGFSIPQVPKFIADAMYSGIDGAKYQNVEGLGEVWTFDCNVEVNVTFKFGGKSFPIHPLDASLDANVTTSDGKEICFGGFQPITTTTGGNFDMILGMAFLRNAYLLIDFGDFVDGSPANTSDPYIQLLALTNDTAEAHADFVHVRGSASSGGNDGGGFNKWLVIRIVVGVAALLLLLGALFMIVRFLRRRRAGGSQPAVGGGGRPWGAGAGTYYPLGTPAPHAAMEVHQGGMQQASYQQPYDAPGRAPPGGEADDYYNQHQGNKQAAYDSPWDQRR